MANSRPIPPEQVGAALDTATESESQADHEEQSTAWLPALLGVLVTLTVVALLFAATFLAIHLFG